MLRQDESLTLKRILKECLIAFIQGDQKVSVHLMITVQKVTIKFKVSPASLHTSIDKPNCVLEDGVQYSTVHIPNVFCDGHLQRNNCVRVVRQVHRDFLITVYITRYRSKVGSYILAMSFFFAIEGE
jgi:hypothetical protein